MLTPLLDRTSPEAIPVQVECGWGYVAALTLTGDVYVWWPFGQDIMQQYAVQMARMDEEGDKRAHATSEGLIPCATWDLHYDPLRLPYIPRLPDMSHRNLDDDADETKLIKIAAMDGFLVGLTNRGHVLKFGDLSNPSALQLGQWEYVFFIPLRESVRLLTLSPGSSSRSSVRPKKYALIRASIHQYIPKKQCKAPSYLLLWKYR